MKSNKIPPLICEGQMVPHSHSMDVMRYRYLYKDGQHEVALLCQRCVKHDRARGYVLERLFEEQTDDDR